MVSLKNCSVSVYRRLFILGIFMGVRAHVSDVAPLPVDIWCNFTIHLCNWLCSGEV